MWRVSKVVTLPNYACWKWRIMPLHEVIISSGTHTKHVVCLPLHSSSQVAHEHTLIVPLLLVCKWLQAILTLSYFKMMISLRSSVLIGSLLAYFVLAELEVLFFMSLIMLLDFKNGIILFAFECIALRCISRSMDLSLQKQQKQHKQPSIIYVLLWPCWYQNMHGKDAVVTASLELLLCYLCDAPSIFWQRSEWMTPNLVAKLMPVGLIAYWRFAIVFTFKLLFYWLEQRLYYVCMVLICCSSVIHAGFLFDFLDLHKRWRVLNWPQLFVNE